MTKILYNACYGGFSVSEAAVLEYERRTGQKIERVEDFEGEMVVNTHYPFSRTDPVLIAIVEEMGDAANGPYASLAIRDLPPGTQYRIDEYDGSEGVYTIDEYEWSIA